MQYDNPTPRLCQLRPRHSKPLDINLSPRRRALIAPHRTKWANGTVLHYHFLDGDGRTANAAEVRRAFAQWREFGIGLEFEEAADPQEAEIRITFRPSHISESAVGREALEYKQVDEPTMNFGWDLTDEVGFGTALHEIGHALGLEHEHQNPNAGIVWDENAVIRYFTRTEGWKIDDIRRNILDHLDSNDIQSSTWDPDSVMHYSFPAGLIISPPGFEREPFTAQSVVSETDQREIRRLYPPIDPAATRTLSAFQSQPLLLEPGQQADFSIVPTRTRQYTIASFGETDLVMVLFEEIDGKRRFVAGSDDAGLDENAKLVQRLRRGHKYRLSVRMAYAAGDGGGAIMMW